MLRGWLLVRNSAARATKTRPLPRLPCEQIEADEMAVVHDVALGYSPAHRKQVQAAFIPDGTGCPNLNDIGEKETNTRVQTH
jgi:hypothetical protein